MKRDELARMLKPLDAIGNEEAALLQRFGGACRDPNATILAVNDFESFERAYYKGGRKTRVDRLRRLYGLYLSLSRTHCPLAMKSLQKFKETLPSYRRASMFYFLNDMYELHAAGIIILRTPVIDALKYADSYRRQHQALAKAARIHESEWPDFDGWIDKILDSKIYNPGDANKRKGKRK